MIVVLNFGSQFAHLIARRVRDLGVSAEVLPFGVSVCEIEKLEPVGIILSGGPASVLERRSPRPKKEIFDMGIPMLGICYGQQIMADMLGGKVTSSKNREYGKETIKIHKRTGPFSGLQSKEIVWFSHGDKVTRLPKGFVNTASTDDCKNAAMADASRMLCGIQFHPEVTHTRHGKQVLSNFLFKICKAKRDWGMQNLTRSIVQEVQDKVGKEHVLIGLSGGVDSLVASALIYKAVGNRLHAVLVDTGLLRKYEVDEVRKAARKLGLKNFHIISAENTFMRRLKGITDPEEKRKIIGHTFIEVFEKATKKELKQHEISYFAQGTIYPDRIESAQPNKSASKIKSHHNLTLPEKFGFEIIEPLRDLYKDEVRRLGTKLGLPRELLWRHPFPGPGLAVRIVGEVTKARLEILREADAIYIEELRSSNEYQKIWQAFAVLLPLKTVGVMGDARTYEYIISLRAVDSVDGMSADWHKMPQNLLERISNRIVREVKGVNRVLYDVTQKPPSTIEYE